jgi:hypothetical protein
MTELRLALRRLGRAPGFAITATLTIALALGANGMIFSAVRGLLVRPLPFDDADRMMWVYAHRADDSQPRGKLTETEAQTLARQTATWDAVATIGDRAFLRVENGRRERWHGLWVSPSLARVLRVRPALGRTITIDDARSGARVLSAPTERAHRSAP